MALGKMPEHLASDSYTVNQAAKSSLLWRLAPYTDLIEQTGPDSVAVRGRVETPYTEHGIVDRQTLFRRLLGSVASDYHWGGSFVGPHHLMWPQRAYCRPGVSRAKAKTTAHFRGNPSLKVILPRELHDYLHRVTEPPKAPESDVMEQYTLEQSQVSRLYSIIRPSGHMDKDLSFDDREDLRYALLLGKLEDMEDGQVGLMPDRELLARLPIAESRQILRHRALPLGISAHKACQRVFFKNNL